MKKKALLIFSIIIAIVAVAGIGIYLKFFNFHPEKLEGNAEIYSVAQTTDIHPDSILREKSIIFLGSSVTEGYAAMGESFVDYLEKEDGILPIKEALSATTLVDEQAYGRDSYVTRMKNLDPDMHVDLLVCQLSTNDAKTGKAIGTISASTNLEDFDVLTVTGAMEYIIAYAKETWGCPVIFYTGARFSEKWADTYEDMIGLTYKLADKWNIGIIDLWNNSDFNNITPEEYSMYMYDSVHPTRAGYKLWWTPDE